MSSADSPLPRISLGCNGPEDADVYLVKSRISLTQPSFCGFEVIIHDMRRRCQSCKSASPSRETHPGRTAHRYLYCEQISC